MKSHKWGAQNGGNRGYYRERFYKTVRHSHSRSRDGVEAGVVDGEFGWSCERIIELTNKWWNDAAVLCWIKLSHIRGNWPRPASRAPHLDKCMWTMDISHSIQIVCIVSTNSQDCDVGTRLDPLSMWFHFYLLPQLWPCATAAFGKQWFICQINVLAPLRMCLRCGVTH